MITERELNIDEAYDRLTRLHQHLGLNSRTTLARTNKLVATCHLYDSAYKEVSCGAGKGEYCELGALAESLEHYFVDDITSTIIDSDQILKSIEPFDDFAQLTTAWLPGTLSQTSRPGQLRRNKNTCNNNSTINQKH